MSKPSSPKRHICCYLLLIPLFLLLLCFHDMLLVHIITPYRCDMWKGKEVEVFLTPEEWRALSGVSESLKDTEWIYYPTIEGKPEKDPFFIKHQGLYQPMMYFNGNKHYLSSINNQHPNLNIYYNVNPNKIIGNNTYILYDQNLEKKIIQYNYIIGYYRLPFFGSLDKIACINDIERGYFNFIKNYLN